MKTIVLVPAAGAGRRMNATVNKPYLTLAGRPILAHTLALFDQHPAIAQIVVITPAAEIPFCHREVVERYRFSKVGPLVAGGSERQDSVRLGLQACGADSDDIILIHDGVRPFFPADLITTVIATAATVGGCVVGVPCKDTIKEVDSGRICATPDRKRLWQAQTPQAFPFHIISAAHQRAVADAFAGTDDASLVERLGLPVAMVEGSYRNLKITTPEDLLLAQAFLNPPEI